MRFSGMTLYGLVNIASENDAKSNNFRMAINYNGA